MGKRGVYMVQTAVNELEELFKLQVANHAYVRRTTAEQRIKKLAALRRELEDNAKAIYKAANLDYVRPEEEEQNQVLSVLYAIDHTMENLAGWMEPEEVPGPPGSKSKIIYEPKGIVCVIGTWNSPLSTSIHPLIDAIAAGNSVILKPSEITAHYGEIIKDIIERVFSKNEVAVVLGDEKVATELLKLPFDHFFYTGSPRIGKIIMEGASKHLSSVTLELGGKSPVIIDKGADLQQAAQQLVFGKVMMGGQICIAPDYIFVHQEDQEAFVSMYKAMTQAMLYDANGAIRNTNRTSIVNERHYERLENLYQDAIDKGAVVLSGGCFDPDHRLIEPTLLGKVTEKMQIAEDEIFGPLTFLIPYSEFEEIADYIKARPKPLALYIFSSDEAFQQKVLDSTTSGGVTINGILLHNTNHHLPFGGVNNSGLGSFHGIHGFRALSHARSVYSVLSE